MSILSFIRTIINFNVYKGSGGDWGERILRHENDGWPDTLTCGIRSNGGHIYSWIIGVGLTL